MKKRNIQRWIKRVSCRVGAFLSTCLILATMVVPAFASNNASTRKWYIAEEKQMAAESGVYAKYFRVSPYVDGTEYSYTSLSYSFSLYSSYTDYNGTSSTFTYSGVIPLNYPDWWRDDLPLGNFSYVDVRLTSIQYSDYLSGPWTDTDKANLYFFDSANSVSLDFSNSIPAGSSSPSASLSDFTFSSTKPIYFTYAPSGSYRYSDSITSSRYASASAITLYKTSSPYTFLLSDTYNLALLPSPFSAQNGAQVFPLFTSVPLSNLASSRFVPAVVATGGQYTKSIFQLSFWVSADKLPPGLQVGDEFPANTDAFDDLRDDLIKQFPEISENVENGKDTINGWNDTETVGQDVAESSLSVINGLFQNLGQFLAVVSLMIFGAVCLRMLIKKAVSG